MPRSKSQERIEKKSNQNVKHNNEAATFNITTVTTTIKNEWLGGIEPERPLISPLLC